VEAAFGQSRGPDTALHRIAAAAASSTAMTPKLKASIGLHELRYEPRFPLKEGRKKRAAKNRDPVHALLLLGRVLRISYSF
jgi:hypothetical protein